MKWSDVEASVTAEVICQKTIQCLDSETYVEDGNSFSGEFLKRLGNGTIISNVVKVK